MCDWLSERKWWALRTKASQENDTIITNYLFYLMDSVSVKAVEPTDKHHTIEVKDKRPLG